MTTLCRTLTRELTSALIFRLRRGRQRKFQVADLEWVLVLAQGGIIRGRRDAKAAR